MELKKNKMPLVAKAIGGIFCLCLWVFNISVLNTSEKSADLLSLKMLAANAQTSGEDGDNYYTNTWFEDYVWTYVDECTSLVRKCSGVECYAGGYDECASGMTCEEPGTEFRHCQ